MRLSPLPSILGLLALVACGGGDADDTDTDVVPGDTDAADTDAEPEVGDVTVVLALAGGEPVVDAVVAVHDEDGAPVTTTTTDASGRAVVEVVGEVMVTVIYADEPWTFVGVEAGDELRLAPPAPIDPGDDEVHVEVGADVGGQTYRMFNGCGSAIAYTVNGGFNLPHGPTCHDGNGRVDVLGLSIVGGAVSGFTSALAVAPEATVTLPTPWRTDWETPTYSVTNAPSGAVDFGASARVRRRGRVYSEAEGESVVVGGGGASVELKVPADFAEDVFVTLTLDFDGERQGRGEVWFVQDGSSPGDEVIDGSEIAAPVDTFAVDTSDPTRPVLSWSGGTAVDGRFVRASVLSALGKGSWRFLIPGERSEVRFPEMPSELAYLTPTSDDPVGEVEIGGATVDGVDARALVTSDAWRLLTSNRPEGGDGESGSRAFAYFTP